MPILESDLEMPVTEPPADSLIIDGPVVLLTPANQDHAKHSMSMQMMLYWPIHNTVHINIKG